MSSVNICGVRLEDELGRVPPLPQVAVIRRAHGTAACARVSREVPIRVARGRAVATSTAASSGTTRTVASRRARVGVTIIAGRASRASERVGGGAWGQLSPDDPGAVAREERKGSGLGCQVVKTRALGDKVRGVAADEVRPCEGRNCGVVAEGQAGFHMVISVNGSEVTKARVERIGMRRSDSETSSEP